MDLLGEQWFQGRTGNVLREKIIYQPDSMMTKDKKLQEDRDDLELIKEQKKILEQINKFENITGNNNNIREGSGTSTNEQMKQIIS